MLFGTPVVASGLPAQPPELWYQVLLLPFFFSAIGAGFWIMVHLAEVRDGKARPFKWIALVLILVVLWAGIGDLMNIMDPVYRMALEPRGRKFIYAHYLAPVIPALTIIGLFIWNFFDRRMQEDRY